MPRNTALLIAVLAIVAALVIGVNIGRSISSKPPEIIQPQNQTSQPTETPTPAISEFIGCGITLTYPQSLTKVDIETGGAMLVNTKNTTESIAIACQKDIPRPALLSNKIESVKIGSTSASLYHDASEKDGSPVDKLIFRNPKNGQDVYISGYGDTFKEILSTITLQ
jgi:hypothetical protein